MSTVLIVEDSSTMRKIISRALRQTSLAVETIFEAGDGFEGLVQLGAGCTIDLILSDINMPNMDGLDFVTAVREKGYQMPIVMLTTEGGEDVINEAIHRGASASIKKPFTPEQLCGCLEGYL
jgi:two-component system, chemotaxis family, chemotaxis protein CheY